jgi:heme-degrading monooxygenase HmoA
MIARIWRGWAPPGAADDYQHHFEAEVSDHLQAVSGFCGARLLRREDGQEVMFTSITYFTGLDAVRAFAGASYEQAVVEQTARQVLSRWDERVSHTKWPSTCNYSRQSLRDRGRRIRLLLVAHNNQLRRPTLRHKGRA